MTARRILKSIILLTLITLGTCYSELYYGLFLGKLLTFSHNVKGEIYAIDSNTLFVKGFSYDGRSNDAVFWTGSSEFPDSSGFHIPNDISNFSPLPASENQDFILKLPGKMNVQRMRWLAVWNRDHSKSLGSLIFLSPLQPPQPMAIGHLVKTKHSISTGDILISDSQTIIVPNFNYDGTGKDAYWLLSKGMKPNGDGIFLLEHGRVSPVTKSEDYTIELTLPDDHFIHDYDILSIWSKSDNDHYGYVDVPKNMLVPPSIRVLQSQEPKMEDFNCEMLNDNLGLEVRWFINGDDIIIHLVGNIAPSEYMALGLSKDDTFSRFDAADAIITGVDKNGKGFAIDYYFESDKKCDNGGGMCSDISYGSEDNLQLLNVEKFHAEENKNFTIVKFKRRLRAEDNVYDQTIYTDGPQAVLWAVGPLDSDGMAESPTLQSRGNLLLDFGRKPMWNCPFHRKVKGSYEYSEYKEDNYSTKETTNSIHCPSDHLFRAQLGISPRNNSQKVWYINGIPAPNLTIQRGITYTFIIEGGMTPPDYHPFYITNSHEGGLYKNILEANGEVEVTYAGIQKDIITDVIFPTAEGRLCLWSQSVTDPELSVMTRDGRAQQPLVLNCEPGKSGKLVWTPTVETPDEVYYQSYTTRNLGGKIRIVDFCEETKPHFYLDMSTTKGGRPNVITSSKTGDFERESESSKVEQLEHAEREDLNIDEKVERLIRDDSPEVIRENFSSLKNDKNNIYNNFIVPPGISSNKLTERSDISEKYLTLRNETSANIHRETEGSEESFPHDESERSDKYTSNLENSKKLSNQINAVLNSHRNTEDLPVKYPTHSTSDASSISALGKPFPQEFKPQFEGGFVPLVTNPMKEKESVQKKEFVLPSHHQNKPHRPFFYNESVPFHDTFKPGVPDFSGFNISNYSQEDVSVIIAPVGQDNLALLSAPKPHSVPRNFPPIGAIPLHLVDRSADILPRPQRVQAFGPRFQPPQQQPSLVEVRKNAFPHLPVNGQPNFSIPNIRGEDLTGVPSQRVYVSMQTTGDNKAGIPNIPNLTGYNRNVQSSQQTKMIYPPAIQRRPDFYENKGGNQRHPNEPQRKFNPPQGFSNINNKQISQQGGKVPFIQSGMLLPQGNNRPKLSNSNMPINNFQESAERNVSPHGPMRIPYPLMHAQQGERIRQNPVLLKSFQLISNPLQFEKTNMNNGYLNHPQMPSLMLPLPIHNLNHSEKTTEAFRKPQAVDPNSLKEYRPSLNLESAESIEVPRRNILPIARDKPSLNQGKIMQKLPFNETLGAFVLSTNLKSPQTILGTLSQENKPSENKSNLSNSNNKFFTPKEDSPLKRNNGENNPETPNILIKAPENLDDNRAEMIIKEKNDKDMKYGETHKFNSRPASFLDHEIDKYVFETSSEEDLSSSKDSQENPVLFLDSKNEELPDTSDSITDADNLHYNVPFGARLKFPQNGSRIPVESINETPKIPSVITKRPQTYSINNANRNLGVFRKSVVSSTSTESTTRPATSVPSTISTTTDQTLIAVESMVSNVFNEKQIASTEKEEKIKHLYYKPSFSTFHVNYQTANSSIQDTKPSDEVKHIPIIADTLDDIVETGYIGRKNIIQNNNTNLSFLSHIGPPKVSEDINLPQIPENPPTHDNRTDYSILHHVLTLIGGPSE